MTWEDDIGSARACAAIAHDIGLIPRRRTLRRYREELEQRDEHGDLLLEYPRPDYQREGFHLTIAQLEEIADALYLTHVCGAGELVELGVELFGVPR